MKKINILLIKIGVIFYIRLILMNCVPVLFLMAFLGTELNFVVIFFIIYSVFMLIFNFIIIIKRFCNYIRLKRLIREGEDIIRYELENPSFINCREYILTESYLFDLREYKFIRYCDIKFMCYHKKKSETSSDFPLVLTLITDKERISLKIWSSFAHFDDYYEDLEKLVKKKNPNVVKCKKRDIKKLMKDIV